MTLSEDSNSEYTLKVEKISEEIKEIGKKLKELQQEIYNGILGGIYGTINEENVYDSNTLVCSKIYNDIDEFLDI